MSEQEQKTSLELADVAEKAASRFSAIWIIPLVAIAIGLWLLGTAMLGKGPTVQVIFETAEGLEIGKTKVLMRHVEVGTVSDIEITKDLQHVVVSLDMKKYVSDHLLTSTRFWVVRPRIGGGSISGLSTLLSGAFIEMDPGMTGEKTDEFAGLEVPPVIKSSEDGTNYILVSSALGSLSQGSPVYYQGVQVGEVMGYQLNEDGSKVDIPVFIRAPYDKFVREDTKFWNASGISVSLNGDGINVRTGTLQSFMRGGISFETVDSLDASSKVGEGHRFVLYKDYDDIKEDIHFRTVKVISYFNESIKGLKPGSPVEFRGLRIGHVVDVKMVFDVAEKTFVAPVLIALQPERMILKNVASEGPAGKGRDNVILNEMIKRGLSAQLVSGNLVTGQMIVDLDLRPGEGARLTGLDDRYTEIPSLPTSSIGEMSASVTAILQKLQKLPLEQIAENLNATLEGTNKIVNSEDMQKAVVALQQAAGGIDRLVAGVEKDVLPKTVRAVDEAKQALGNVNAAIDKDSPLRYDLSETLKELSSAARSIRLLADYLERNPNALIYGKQQPKRGQ